jgi:hypothetical protein
VGTASSLVCSIGDMLAKLILNQYIYKILPYPVNLKQEGEKARSARSARDKRKGRDTKFEVPNTSAFSLSH